jgi:hypothetical protein
MTKTFEIQPKPALAAEQNLTYANENLQSGGNDLHHPLKRNDLAPQQGHLEVTNIFSETCVRTSKAQRAEAEAKKDGDTLPQIKDGTQPAAAPNEAAPKKDWTVVINLAANLGDAGARPEAERLKKMAESTNGRSVNIVVQSIKPSSDANHPDAQTIERFVLHDGKIESLPGNGDQNKSLGNDLKEILQLANKQFPSEKIALINMSHGLGNKGIVGDAGALSLKEFNQSVKDGLSGSVHEKLDLLDWNACLMAESGAISEASKIAHNLVASSETERPNSYNGGGQNLPGSLDHLLHDSKIDGKQLARDFVDEANNSNEHAPNTAGKPKTESLSTATLGAYDLGDGLQKFKNKEDRFEQALADSVRDPANRKIIEKLAGTTPQYGLHSENTNHQLAEFQRRDLKQFLDGVRDSIANGSLKDPDSKLKSATDELSCAREQMLIAYHGDKSSGYDRMGGVSMWLPTTGTFDSKTPAVQFEPLKRITEIQPTKVPEERREDLLRGAIKKSMEEIHEMVPQEQKQPLRELEEAVQNLDNVPAGRIDDVVKAANSVIKVATRLYAEHPEVVNSLIGVFKGYEEERYRKNFEQEAQPESDSWRNLMTTWHTELLHTD